MNSSLILEANDQMTVAFNNRAGCITRVDFTDNGLGYDLHFKCNIAGWVFVK